MNKRYYTIGEAASLLGVAVVTLRRWVNNHQLTCERTFGGHRRFKHDVLFPSAVDGTTILYASVSSRDQKEDLQRQVHVLQEHATAQKWNDIQIIQDIGSGLNTRKAGLRKLVALVLARKVKRLVLTHKDRLLRFANDLLLDICRTLGVEVILLRHEEKDSQTHLYGRRSHKNKKNTGNSTCIRT
jgi:putative resolvase